MRILPLEVRGGMFWGAGGVGNLEEILNYFRQWYKHQVERTKTI